MRRPWRTWIAGSLLAGSWGCGGEEPPPPPRVPERIALLSGNNQDGPVGTKLPSPLTFEVADRQGGLAGVRVSFQTSDLTGFASPTSAATGPDGRIQVSWTVGGSLGQQTLTATVTDIPPAVASATVRAGSPALIAPASNPNQFVVVGRDVTEPPAARVTDAFGNPLAGHEVTFIDPTGRSMVVGTPSTTNAAGIAGITSWRIGHQAGGYTLRASVATGASAQFLAVGTPANALPAAGSGQTANAGTLVPVAPAVRAVDDAGQGLADVPVRFVAVAGGGRLLGAATATTDASGLATSSGWILGAAPGPNELRAEIDGIPPVTFAATGVAAVPAQVDAATATGLTGVRGNFATPTPAIRIRDQAGQPVAGHPVTFTLTAGDGDLARSHRATDHRGVAELGAWRLGAPGPSTVTATAQGMAPLTFTATANPPVAPAFSIEVRFIGPAPTASQQAAFAAAAERWESAILGDIPDLFFDSNENDLTGCGGQIVREVIDDVLIFATIDDIDGQGGVLGQAGACWLRDESLLTLVGRMVFDRADVAALQTAGRFEDVLRHEMGHVLGIGSLWGPSWLNLLAGAGGADPHFIGAAARAAWAHADAGETYAGNIVPVENGGGPGTREVHWREVIAGNELMTGFLNNGANPLSAVTIASLRDEGYEVDDSVADPFTLADALRALESGPPTRIGEAPLGIAVRTVDRTGRVRRIFLPGIGPRRY